MSTESQIHLGWDMEFALEEIEASLPWRPPKPTFEVYPEDNQEDQEEEAIEENEDEEMEEEEMWEEPTQDEPEEEIPSNAVIDPAYELQQWGLEDDWN